LTTQANERPATEMPKSNSPKAAARTPGMPHLVSVSERPRAVTEAESPVRTDTAAMAGVGSFQASDQSSTPVFRRYAEAPAKRYPLISTGLKRLLDLVGIVALALVFSPLIIAIVVLMSREEGPILFRHRRIGRHGRSFECLKFRTMVPNADHALRELFERQPELKAEWISNHKLRNDPRITRIGKFLRRTSLDELPQLWNVLRGDMSLVGPRPIVREELMRYGRNSQSYLSVKPGITGLWQVTGRNDTDYRRRVAIDVYYVRKQNLLLDLYILLKTTRVVLAGDGAY
jgi:exopolysaccharide production protein ExoY